MSDSTIQSKSGTRYSSSYDPVVYQFEGISFTNTTPFEKDTLSAAPISLENEVKSDLSDLNQKKSPGFIEKISSTFNWIWGSIFAEKIADEENSLKTSTDLGIIKQSNKSREHFNKEIGDMYERIFEINEQYGALLKDNTQNKEAILLKLLTLAIKKQLNLKENQGSIALLDLEFHKKEKVKFHDEVLKMKEELEKLSSRSDFAGKIDKAVTIVAGVVLLATVGGGVGALPADMVTLLPTFQTLTTVAKSGTTLLEGYTKGGSEQKEKELYLLNAKKELASQGISIEFEKLNETMQGISSIWQLLREIAEKQKQTSSNMLQK